MSLNIRGLRPTDWPGLHALFGERGGCGGCWCMAWRLTAGEWEAGRGSSNEKAMRDLVESGEATGVVALDGEDFVGWCSVAPRSAFIRLEKMRSLRTEWDADTWSVSCFFLRQDRRGEGIGTRLLEGAVELARDNGANALEGYPATHYEAMGKLPSAFAWTGLPQMFESAGFHVAPTSGKRSVYRIRLSRNYPCRRHP